ncbi:hypothetical protein SK128_026746 [Halocaridina rubra]|uniref:C2H2-type domain-containing protein n=1 Tax=Halocaridina rubra TaxID=373956 RepID=A0AAN8WV39_HALRR
MVTGKIHHCPYCSYITHNKTHMTIHVRKHTGERPHACPHCSYRTVQENNLKRHVLIHSKEKIHSCSYCKFRTDTLGALQRHIQRLHVGSFAIGGRSDTKKRHHTLQVSLGGRKNTPGMSKIHRCPYCSYSTPKKTHMTSHVRIHTKEKPFCCLYCPLRFTQKGNLHKHMMTHVKNNYVHPSQR